MHISRVILAAIFFFAPAPVLTQDWSAVQSLEPGTRVYVTTKSGSEIKAKISAVSDSSAELRANGGSITIRKDEILTIHLTRRGSIVKRALIGAAAGAGIGAAVGAGVVAATKSDGLAAAGGFLYGIPIGAVIGAATTGHKRGRLIFSAQ